MSSRYSIVHIRVKAETEFGQVVHVAGSAVTMGNFNPSEAVALVTTPEEYPYWRTDKPIVVPRGVPEAYKYVIFENGHFLRWESLDIPRVIYAESLTVKITDEIDIPPADEEEEEEQSAAQAARRDLIQNLRRTYSESAGNERDMLSASRKLLDDSRKQYSPPKGAKLYLVCFHMPVIMKKNASGEWTAEWTESLIAKTENSISSDMETHWVGTVSSKDLSQDDKAAIEAVLLPLRCHPIFIPEDMYNKHYLCYCKQVMWPLFHNVEMLDSCSAYWLRDEADPETAWNTGGEEGWWETYYEVNKIFCDTVVEVCQLNENDVLWVHDYHLMLLPAMVSNHEMSVYGKRVSSIIFFLHIPFPTSQIFRALAYGEELLNGMLSADVIGFHAFDHARHFLNACKRIMGLSYHNKSGGLIGIEFQGRTVTVLISHVGIETSQLEKAMEDERTRKGWADLQKKHQGKMIIAGLDPCQRLSGIALKLLAFEKLLNDYACYRDKVVLVQRSLVSGTRVEDEKITQKEVRELVERVNSKFGPGTVDYAELGSSFMPMHERVALWEAADVLMISAIREGLNLHPLEFTYVKAGGEKNSAPGVVLASEFSACSSMLNGASRMNPFDFHRVTTALDHALSLDAASRAQRRERDLPYISHRPSSLWTRQVLQDLWSVKAEVPMLSVDMSGSSLNPPPVWRDHFRHLNIDELRGAYAKAERRFIFTDFGGTLMEKENVDLYIKRSFTQTTGKRPNESVMKALKKLSEDPKNEVFVISGLQLLPLEEVFGNLKKLGLAAGNGLYVSMPDTTTEGEQAAVTSPGSSGDAPPEAPLTPQRKGKKRSWSLLDYGVNWTEVKDVALPIFERYTARTNGSSVRLRDPGIAWSYYSTDPEWGLMQAKALIAELEVALIAHEVKVVHLKGMVEVVPKGLNKGVVLRYAIQHRAGPSPDFIFCIGDDASDEFMFTAIYSYIADQAVRRVQASSSPKGGSSSTAPPPPSSSSSLPKQQEEEIVKYVATCTVGKQRSSHASFYVTSSREVGAAFSALASV